MKKQTLKQKVDILIDNEWSLNAMERFQFLERFVEDFKNGKYVIVPAKRFEALEKHLKVKYRINKSGNYVKK